MSIHFFVCHHFSFEYPLLFTPFYCLIYFLLPSLQLIQHHQSSTSLNFLLLAFLLFLTHPPFPHLAPSSISEEYYPPPKHNIPLCIPPIPPSFSPAPTSPTLMDTTAVAFLLGWADQSCVSPGHYSRVTPRTSGDDAPPTCTFLLSFVLVSLCLSMSVYSSLSNYLSVSLSVSFLSSLMPVYLCAYVYL